MMMLVLLALFACSTPEPTPTGPPVVRSLSHPVGWLVERLAGDEVDHSCVQPAGSDARSWRPDGTLIASLAGADLVVAQGAGFEAWTATASLRRDRFVDTTAGLDLIRREARTHSHGADGTHSHGVIDPHTWSDPTLMLAQAKAIASRLDGHVDADTLSSNMSALEGDLMVLDRQLRTTLSPLSKQPFAANHPAYGYLARRYTLDIQDFDLDPTKANTQDLSSWTTKGGRTLLWETPPSEVATQSLPTLRHVWIDPLEQPDGKVYDYLRQSTANLARWTELAAGEM